MFIKQCDLCKKTIKEKEESIRVSICYPFSEFMFCAKCGEPIKKILKNKKMIKKD
jgi:rRNA maturation endonuclease Nob1